MQETMVKNRKEYSKEENDMMIEYSKQREARQQAEGIAYANENERRAYFERKQHEQQTQVKRTLESAKADMDEERRQHDRRMHEIVQQAESTSETWRRLKPVLVSAMLGGAFSLLLTKPPSRSS